MCIPIYNAYCNYFLKKTGAVTMHFVCVFEHAGTLRVTICFYTVFFINCKYVFFVFLDNRFQANI